MQKGLIHTMRRKKKLFIISIILCLFVVGLVAFRNTIAATLFREVVAPKLNEKLNDTYVPINEIVLPKKVADKDPFSFLLLGVDQREGETGRSDTMIFGVFQPATNLLKLISIPRDSYIYLPTEDSYDKANHAFAYGGTNGAVKAVEYLFEQPIDYYMSINFLGVVQIIDSIGGIELDIKGDLINDDPDHEHFIVKANQDKYFGVDALNFLRFREDAGGDISRTSRNQEFITAFLKKTLSFGNITKVNKIFTIVGNNFKTNIPPSQITEHIARFIEKDEKSILINSVTLIGEGVRLGEEELYYINLDETQLESIKKQIDKDMGDK